jgi:hypothetical protein
MSEMKAPELGTEPQYLREASWRTGTPRLELALPTGWYVRQNEIEERPAGWKGMS